MKRRLWQDTRLDHGSCRSKASWQLHCNFTASFLVEEEQEVTRLRTSETRLRREWKQSLTDKQ